MTVWSVNDPETSPYDSQDAVDLKKVRGTHLRLCGLASRRTQRNCYWCLPLGVGVEREERRRFTFLFECHSRSYNVRILQCVMIIMHYAHVECPKL